MVPSSKPGMNGAAGFQKGLSCESCHSKCAHRLGLDKVWTTLVCSGSVDCPHAHIKIDVNTVFLSYATNLFWLPAITEDPCITGRCSSRHLDLTDTGANSLNRLSPTQRLSLLSGTPGVPQTCSADCAPPVGFTGRSMEVWRLPHSLRVLLELAL